VTNVNCEVTNDKYEGIRVNYKKSEFLNMKGLWIK
jgi:hypothetical protein